MQNAGMNMISGGHYKKETDAPVSRSFSVNRAFGKDITNKVLNSTGAVTIPNQGGKGLQPSMDSDKPREIRGGSQGTRESRKPSPSIMSNCGSHHQ
jgi:hypothetical protein